MRIVFNQEKLTHSRPLLRSLNALNAYQINLYQHLNFMHKVSNNVAPLIFNGMFKKPSHKYPTNFSHNNFSLKKCSLNSTKYSISFRGPKLWNEFLNTDEKQISSYNLFSRKVKSKLLDTENEVRYFWNFAEIITSNLFGFLNIRGYSPLRVLFWQGVFEICAVDLWGSTRVGVWLQ